MFHLVQRNKQTNIRQNKQQILYQIYRNDTIRLPDIERKLTLILQIKWQLFNVFVALI